MKIQAMQISNILSFEYRDDIDICDNIQFDEKLNLILGPNGTGKSNFIEIINQLFKRILFYNFTFDESIIELNQSDPTRYPLYSCITRQNSPHSLKRNYRTNTEKKQIKIEIQLGDDDLSNLLFIYNNIDELRGLFAYFHVSPQLRLESSNLKDSDLKEIKKISFKLTENKDSDHAFTLDENKYSPAELFISEYIKYFRLINYLIFIGNKYQSKHWSLLKNTFALIGESVNYNAITSIYKVVPNEENEKNRILLEIMKENARYANVVEPSLFLFVKCRIAYLFNRYSWEHDNKGGQNPHIRIEDQIFFKKINDLLESTLNFSIRIETDEFTKDHIFFFIDNNGHKLDINELSAGEKSIIHFIFCIYGYDLNNGLMIIDEPESHIHPQIQKKFLNIIRDASQELNLQFVIVTHSSIMVHHSTISSIFRFYKDLDNYTKIVKPILDKDDRGESTLVRILTYTNSSKIFFAKKIILVEGATDEYFYRVFLERVTKDSDIVEEVEVLSIEGKGEFNVWRKFLDKFKISNYYIGDLDNILDDQIEIITAEHKKRLIEEAKKYDPSIADNQNKEILKVIKENSSSEWKSIHDSIDLYPNNVLILKEGELEDYLEISKKNLEQVINFCQTKFESWYNKDDKSKEIYKMFKKILS